LLTLQSIASLTGVFECQPNGVHVSLSGLSDCQEMAATAAIAVAVAIAVVVAIAVADIAATDSAVDNHHSHHHHHIQ